METSLHKNIFQYLQTELYVPKIKASIILGSGLGTFADELKKIKSIPTSRIPDYPHSTVVGHAGEISLCEYYDELFLVFKGRIHAYEGYSLEKIIIPAVLAYKFNSEYLVVTNAAGGINQNFKPGDLMIIEDVFYLHYKKRFKSLADFSQSPFSISRKLNDFIFALGLEINLELKRGVYGYSLGPSYETPAEIEFLKRAGCDAVGMSTIPEIIYSSKVGMKTIGISCITNLAAGISKTKLTHDEVTENANLAKYKFSILLRSLISNLH